jgi:TfoX/Sxy family transcriptional regulator of competence genes
MAYDERLAQRIRDVLAARDDVEERKMFGGIAFMVGSHMACGVIHHDLMLRVGAAGEADALAQPHARPMDFTHRPMVGMVYVAPAGVRTAAALRGWVARAEAFVATLPPKKPAKARVRKASPRT